MDDVLRRLRGLLGVGATWAIAWGAIGALIGVAFGIDPLVWAPGLAAYGGISGLGFGALLSYHERKKSLDELTPARAAVWGVLGAVAVPLLFLLMGTFDATTTALDVVEAMGLTAVLGGTFAAGSVALARRAHEPLALEGEDSAPALEPARTHEPSLRTRAAEPSRDSAARRDPSRT